MTDYYVKEIDTPTNKPVRNQLDREQWFYYPLTPCPKKITMRQYLNDLIIGIYIGVPISIGIIVLVGVMTNSIKS